VAFSTGLDAPDVHRRGGRPRAADLPGRSKLGGKMYYVMTREDMPEGKRQIVLRYGQVPEMTYCAY
jgi:hypothetical protein